ncbi:MAG: glycosyltransferase family 4 protein [Chloroflexi bacterium]|jgi:L-malate glycosyltransferase|nr:glycosyltransferase family 4 protein [Chloroflexota bacterium]
MKILYFSREYTTHDHRFLSKLAQTEHQIGYLRLESRGHALDDRPLPPEIEQLHWAGGQSKAELRDALRLVRSLKRVIRTFKPDIVQAGPIQTAALLTALTGFRRLVSMSWGYDLLMDADRNRWWRWATEYTLKRSAAFLGDCDTIRNLAVQHGMNPERIVTFPWGANIQKYAPGDDGGLRKRLGWGADTFVLLSTRGWSPIYGVEDLAQAFVQAARQRPELRLLMLGNGPLAPTIRRIFMNADLLDRVHFPGQVKQADLPNYYRAADLYISTSHSDGTSISLLEALACGTPVLLTDIPGNQEWVKRGSEAGEGEGRSGWLFKDGDMASLRDGILHALDLREQLPAMSVAARHLAESRADWEKNFPKLFEVYRLALSA